VLCAESEALVTALQPFWRLMLACLVLLTTACAAANPGPSPTPAAIAEPAQTVLVLWHAWPAPEQRTLIALIDRFNRANPTVQVIPQARPIPSLAGDVSAAIAEGAGPHLALVQSHIIGSLADDGRLLPLDGLFDPATPERLLPAAIGSVQVDRGVGPALYGLPITFDTLALYFNRQVVLRPPGDTAAMLDAARGLTSPQSDPPFWGMAYNLNLDRTFSYFYAFGGRLFDDQQNPILGVEGRSGAEAWLTWLTALRRDEGLLASLDGVTVDNALLARQAAMTIDWAHALGNYRSLWPESLGVAPLPRLSGEAAAPLPYVQSDALVLNARISGTEQRAATDFLTFMVSEAAQRELLRAGRQPVLLSLDLNAANLDLPADLRAAAEVFRRQGEAGQPMPNSRAANEIVWPILKDMHAGALRGLLTPEQAVSNADTALRVQLGLQPQP
jgi:maltose-binding protein MalE